MPDPYGAESGKPGRATQEGEKPEENRDTGVGLSSVRKADAHFKFGPWFVSRPGHAAEEDEEAEDGCGHLSYLSCS